MNKIAILLFIFVVHYGFAQSEASKLNRTAIADYTKDPKKSIELLEKALSLAQKNKETKEIGAAYNNLGVVYRDLGKFETSKDYSQKALKILKDPIDRASAYNNIGACNRNLGKNEEAIKYYLKALKIYESTDERNKEATVLNNIGMVYSYLGIRSKSEDFLMRAKVIFEKNKDQKGISQTYNNLAILYASNDELSKSLDYFKYSLAIEEKLKDIKGIAESANNVGEVFRYMQQFDSAEVYFERSISLEKSIGNYTGVGASYNSIAQMEMENNRYAEAKRYIDSAYAYVTKNNSTNDIILSLENYSIYYEGIHQPEKALEYFKKYTMLKDSTMNIAANDKILELEIVYETQKKENKILKQDAEIAQKDLLNKRKNFLLFGSLGLALIIGLIGYLFFKQQKLKNIQLQKDNELKTALAQIESHQKMEELRLRISRDLHDNIGSQLTFIISTLDNLKYKFNINDEQLTDRLQSVGEFTRSTITDLRNTIWAMNKGEISFTDLENRISNFVQKAELSTENIAFSFTCDERINADITFSSLDGMNIYRIIQEAVNNALKYAESQEISIAIKQQNNGIEIIVKDTGKGFDPTTVELSFGIENMQKRAKEIGGSLAVHSEIGKGTEVRLQI